jgi:hypothetical protein
MVLDLQLQFLLFRRGAIYLMLFLGYLLFVFKICFSKISKRINLGNFGVFTIQWCYALVTVEVGGVTAL